MFDPEVALDEAARAAAASGDTTFRRLMLTLLPHLAARVDDMPPVAVEGLDTAGDYWHGRQGGPADLEAARIAVWTYLDAKHGNSYAIQDPEDHLLRAVLCVLYPEEAEPGETAYFFRDMMAKSGS